jgi:hypothetical protein
VSQTAIQDVGSFVMSLLVLTFIVFACVFGSAMLGIYLCPLLPDKDVSSDSRDAIRLGMGLVATMVALVLGLLVASAKSFFDTQCAEVTQLSADFVLLDRTLKYYGPEARETRAALRTLLTREPELVKLLQGSEKGDPQDSDSVAEKIQQLTPKDDNQRTLKAQALSLLFQLGQTRWLMFEQNTVPIPRLLFVMLISWLVMLFASFGLFAPRNATVLTGLLLSAVAVCGAILLILELYHSQAGLIRVSDAPLKAAITQMGP